VSNRSVSERLQVKPSSAVWVSDSSHLDLIQPLPEGVRLAGDFDQASVALIFADDAASLRRILAERASDLARPSALWVAYPKANRADINRDSLWPILAEYGMRPVAQVSLDEVWSALRFRPRKEGEAPFTGGRQA
jgi:hypothetical protein